MTDEHPSHHDPETHPPADQRGTDAGDRIRSAQGHLLGGAPQDGGAHGTPTPSRQETLLREWAESLGLLLNPDDLPAKVIKGGQEHDVYLDESTQRVFKLTRHGVFYAHDKNLVHAGDTLVPFDVIPCQPDGGFLEFIQQTLAAGHSVHAVRSTHTSTRS